MVLFLSKHHIYGSNSVFFKVMEKIYSFFGLATIAFFHICMVQFWHSDTSKAYTTIF